VSSEEELMLGRVPGPVLDVGCGPGRHVAALAARGIPSLGIDIAPQALDFARRRGGSVLNRSVFDRVPGAGRWGGALLLDGNVGIGGDPAQLFRRVASLLRPDGQLLVELAPPGAGAPCRTVCLDIDGQRGPWFRWRRVTADELADLAADAFVEVLERWTVQSRWFAALGSCEP
jgi:SAM-dependent methyltransferase